MTRVIARFLKSGMEVVRHLQRLNQFSSPSYDLLESLAFLREKECLSPLWLAMETRLNMAFRVSKINREGWAWQLDDTTDDLFHEWRFNRKNLKLGEPRFPYKDSMRYQLERAEAQVDLLFQEEKKYLKENQKEMQEELQRIFIQKKEQMIRETEALIL